jgi:polar amino acid transport system substrate-binding protein
MKKTTLLMLIILAAIALMAGCRKTEIVIANLDDAKNARIGVMTGSTGEALTIKRFPKAQVKSFDDIMDAVAAMNSGQLDAIVTAFPAALQVSKKSQQLGLLSEPLDYEDTAIAVKKGNDELLAALNRIIAELKSDGTLESMKKRWFKPDLSPYEEMDIPLPTEGTPLKIGVSATREPFSFVDQNGRVTGHDGELARIIGAKLNRPIEFFNMKFMALVPALQSGKIDLIVTGMTATDERKKYVDFTAPYYANAQVMLVRKNAAATPTSAPVSSDNEVAKLEDIDGKRVAVLGGSAGDLAARKHFPNASFQVFVASADAALAVKARKADAFVYDKSVLLNLAEKNPELVILDQPVDKLEVAAAIRKDNAALLAGINNMLSELKQEGMLQKLRSKWIDTKYTATPQIPPINGNQGKDVLRMGTCATIEPFSFQADGRLTGLDIELSQLMGQRLGKKIEIIDMNFEGLIPALQSGKIDFALSNFNVTEERKKLVNFSMAYVENDISALVRRLSAQDSAAKKQDAKLASVADLKDKRIGVLVGSAHDTYATKHFPEATILQYKSPSDVALAVKTGKVDAALFDAEPLREIMRQDDSFGLLGDSLFTFDVGVGFKKDNQTLRDQFNRFLAEIKQNGVHRDMIQRWMEQGDMRMPVIKNAKTHGVIVAGVSDAGLPFTAIKDNRLVGFDIELCERFAAYLGKEVKFANMDFGSLIAAVSTRKVDMISSAIYVTEERKKQIDFSEPYYEMGTNVFALGKNLAAHDETEPNVAMESPAFFVNVADSFRSNIIQENRYLLIWDGLKTTVIISIFATLFGTLLGALICFMRMSSRTVLNLPARIYINILRGMPVLVLLMLIFYVVFASVDINPVLVAVIAFGMNFAAYVSEIFRSGIEGIGKGQIEAGIAMGFTKFKTFVYIVLPQTVQRILPVYKGEFISLVKMTSIVGYIAVQDLTKASDIIRSRTFDAFFPLVMVAILYFVIAWILMLGVEYLERITDPKYKRRKAAKS